MNQNQSNAPVINSHKINKANMMGDYFANGGVAVQSGEYFESNTNGSDQIEQTDASLIICNEFDEDDDYDAELFQGLD